MSTIIAATPGFAVLELHVLEEGVPLECTAHPVIAWRIEQADPLPGSVEPRYISWPITATDWERSNALLLPSGEVEWPDGRFDDVTKWLQSMDAFLRDKKRA